jgi:hypothetical protein
VYCASVRIVACRSAVAAADASAEAIPLLRRHSQRWSFSGKLVSVETSGAAAFAWEHVEVINETSGMRPFMEMFRRQALGAALCVKFVGVRLQRRGPYRFQVSGPVSVHAREQVPFPLPGCCRNDIVWCLSPRVAPTPRKSGESSVRHCWDEILGLLVRVRIAPSFRFQGDRRTSRFPSDRSRLERHDTCCLR